MSATTERAERVGAPEVVVVTGLSGAGRTTAAKVLEDLGYFVIDNLPAGLIEPVMKLATGPGAEVRRLALVVDVRGRAFPGEAAAIVADLHRRDVDPRVLFLDSSDEALVTRFEAARRPHPLAATGRVLDGIQREREVLAPLRAEADLVVDTTDTNVHELRDRLREAFGGTERRRGLVVNLLSFGFKNGTPRDADLVLDVRFLPNPHWVEELRPYTGLDEPVRRYVLRQPDTGVFLERLGHLLDLLVPAFQREGKHYLTIAIGCTGGKHRSVVLAEEVAGQIRDLGFNAQVEHRDRLRE